MLLFRFLPFLVIQFAVIACTYAQHTDTIVVLSNWTDTTIQKNYSGVRFNEVWGFVQDGKEYGVIGSTEGTHIIQIKDDNTLTEVARIPGKSNPLLVVHRDFHDHNGYLYGVCQQDPDTSTMQVVDLHDLPNSAPVVYDTNNLVGTAHNIFIDAAMDKMYVCGSNTTPAHPLMILSLSDPQNPLLDGIWGGVDYVHDAFVRNDTAYLNCAAEGLVVGTFTPSENILGSLNFYSEKGYNHSGWLSEHGNTYIFADETAGMRLKACDVSDLSDIKVESYFGHKDTTIIPHNIMLKDGIAYVSYYSKGLEIYNVRDITDPQLSATFNPQDTGRWYFDGVWGVYAFLPSGRLLVSDRNYGLYLADYTPPAIVDTSSTDTSAVDLAILPEPFVPANAVRLNFDDQGSPFDLYVYDYGGKLILHETNITSDYYYLNRLKITAGAYIYQFRSARYRKTITGRFGISDSP